VLLLQAKDYAIDIGDVVTRGLRMLDVSLRGAGGHQS
jgi:hypothetical protein